MKHYYNRRRRAYGDAYPQDDEIEIVYSTNHRYEIIAYERELSQQEIEKGGLTYLGTNLQRYSKGV